MKNILIPALCLSVLSSNVFAIECKPDKPFKYFVSFTYFAPAESGQGKQLGVGDGFFCSQAKITYEKDVESLKKSLEASTTKVKLHLMSYQPVAN